MVTCPTCGHTSQGSACCPDRFFPPLTVRPTRGHEGYCMHCRPDHMGYMPDHGPVFLFMLGNFQARLCRDHLAQLTTASKALAVRR